MIISLNFFTVVVIIYKSKYEPNINKFKPLKWIKKLPYLNGRAENEGLNERIYRIY